MNGFTKTESGVVIMKGDLAWGVVWDDGQGRSPTYGWIDEVRRICVYPVGLTRPESVTWSGSSDVEELRKGTIVEVNKTTTIEYK